MLLVTLCASFLFFLRRQSLIRGFHFFLLAKILFCFFLSGHSRFITALLCAQVHHGFPLPAWANTLWKGEQIYHKLRILNNLDFLLNFNNPILKRLRGGKFQNINCLCHINYARFIEPEN